ncbi:PLP-dependent transferase, partial [Staphylococcus aureus]|uniref:PLP-dependent transferase n=1 Tax=Staphylococcus aureus TaxID=1280 RepID=UPI00164278B8
KLAQPLPFISNSTAPILPPQHTYLLLTAIKTLPLPIQQINPTLIQIIKILQPHPPLQQLFHPTIQTHLNHHLHIPQPDPHTPLIPFQLKHTQTPKQFIKP